MTNNNPFKVFIPDFEVEAENFLKKYCNKALTTPMAVPIWDIARKKMSLEIIQTESLSPDESVQGAICFANGIIDVYDWSAQEYVGYEAKGTMVFLDADIINPGRLNNTLAHECYHWFRHRRYFLYEYSHNKSTDFAFRCDRTIIRDKDSNAWTEEEKMEWQARTIAPKILMPKNCARVKIEEFYKKAIASGNATQSAMTQSVICSLAEFFHVSKQVAAIRMVDLGYNEASGYCQYTDDMTQTESPKKARSTSAKKHQQPITEREAFDLYCSNEFLRAAIDTGEFHYADGFFVINDEKYVVKSNQHQFILTGYAKAHLAECTLDFTKKLIPQRSDSGYQLNVMFSSETEFTWKASYDSTPQNTEVFNKADALKKARAEFDAQFNRSKSMHQTANERLWQHMQFAHWNSTTFQTKTLLNSMDYTRVQNPVHRFQMPAIIAMAVGLNLTLQETQEILQSAGLTFSPTDKTHQAYSYILASHNNWSIYECNEFLSNCNLKLLGAQTRK